jgi:hypothetical protein
VHSQPEISFPSPPRLLDYNVQTCETFLVSAEWSVRRPSFSAGGNFHFPQYTVSKQLRLLLRRGLNVETRMHLIPTKAPVMMLVRQSLSLNTTTHMLNNAPQHMRESRIARALHWLPGMVQGSIRERLHIHMSHVFIWDLFFSTTRRNILLMQATQCSTFAEPQSLWLITGPKGQLSGDEGGVKEMGACVKAHP